MANNTTTSTAIVDVIAERQRQAVGVLVPARNIPREPVPGRWPWEDDAWKPTNPRRDLVKAAALIIAEIERIDRAGGCAGESNNAQPAAALDIASDVRAVVQLLSEGEWADHCTKTDLGQQLEAEITRLVGAAMLSQNHSERNLEMAQGGNSPVIPDGWIPCSERMPEYGASADGSATGCLVLYERDATPDGGFNVGVWNVVYLCRCWNGIVSHWMPLPTPPAQEDGQ